MSSRNKADSRKKTPSRKAAVETAADRLLKETMAILNREKVFPKRSRWMFAYTIADIVNRYHTMVSYANGITVTNHGLFAERYIAQTLAIAWIYALNVKMTAAQICCDAPVDAFDYWANLWADAEKLTKAWRAGDKNRYEEQFGSLTADELREASAVSRAGL